MVDIIQEQIDEHVRTALQDKLIAGLALGLFEEGEPIFCQGYGFANLEHQLPATPDTVFSIASITKLFTGTAVFQLIEQGKLKLSDELGAHLPDLPLAWRSVQVHHILAHQSGIKSYTEMPDYWDTTRLDIPREEILALVADLPLQFAPGERYAYDNTGYYLLGLLIEAVSGQRYGEYLQQHILAPLQMSRTRVNDPYAIVPGRATGYTVEADQIRHAPYYSPSGTFSAGVLLSSVHDLGRFGASLYTDVLLSETSRQQMWTRHPSQAQNELVMHFQVGYSWFFVSPPGKRPFVGHNGGIMGYASAFIHYEAERLTAVALYNTDTVAEPHALCQDIVEIYLSQ